MIKKVFSLCLAASAVLFAAHGICDTLAAEVMAEATRPMLIPCGTPFGIKLTTDGVVVASTGMIEGAEEIRCPADECGIKPGDIITEVNGKRITSNSDISSAVQIDDKKTEITVKSGDEKYFFTAEPIRSEKDNKLKLGMWVRDSSAGIGTVTYYDPKDGSFGSLGHPVCDIDTGVILPIGSGQTVNVLINRIIKGERGAPGELYGSFFGSDTGDIISNTECGIFGKMYVTPCDNEEMSMAYTDEIHTGDAYIYTTIDGTEPKKYDVEIEYASDDGNNRDMVIHITDPELLNKTGGIVQGMSGSPIIQDNMLIGAVTHVFVNDTTRGYGISAEKMYKISSSDIIREAA